MRRAIRLPQNRVTRSLESTGDLDGGSTTYEQDFSPLAEGVGRGQRDGCPSAAYAQSQSSNNNAAPATPPATGVTSQRITPDSSRGGDGQSAPILATNGNESTFRPIQPCRVMDTRIAGGILGTGETRGFRLHDLNSFTLTGGDASCATLPSTPNAYVANVTVTGWVGSGYLTFYPANAATRPSTSTINYSASLPSATSAIANGITLIPALTGSDDFKIFASAGTHVVIDLIGYYDESELAMSEVVVNQAVAAGASWDFSAVCPVGASVTGGGYNFSGTGQNVEFWQATTERSSRRFHSRGKNYSTDAITVTLTAECLSGTTAP